jgi:hypothetical protein
VAVCQRSLLPDTTRFLASIINTMDRTKRIKRKASDIADNSEPALKKPDIDDEQNDEIISDIIKKVSYTRDFRTYLESIDKNDVIAEFPGVVFGYGDVCQS